MAEKKLDVLLAGDHAGIITQRQGGRHRFEYFDEYRESAKAIPLSYSIPLQQKQHGTREITNFMWGLLPDNENTLRRWGVRYKVSAANPFALLSAIGEDCPGAVQIVPQGRKLEGRENVKWLKKGDLEKRIKALKNDAGAGRLENDTGQFSLAGSQEKTALYRVNDRWGVPQGRTPTTHILKPETGRVQYIATNEHYCLLLARKCGLPAARSEVQILDDIPVIIVERFDRIRKNKMVRRIHQEDMCQALGKREKYQQEGGPGIFDIMELLRFSSSPEEDRDRFMRAQVFNYLIAGTDAHARNYSIVYAPGGEFRLAPLYDVISDLPYASKGHKSTLAMSIGGNRVISRIRPHHWSRLAKSVRYSRNKLFENMRDLLGVLPKTAIEVKKICDDQGLDSPVIETLTSALEKRCKSISKSFGAAIADRPQENARYPQKQSRRNTSGEAARG